MSANSEVVSKSSVSISLQLSTLEEIREFCTVLSTTDMVPKAYKGKPDDILVSILHGQEVGLPHLQALQSIAVVNGIPSIYGDAALAMVRSSGKLEDFDEWIEVDGVRQEGPFPILKLADEDKKIVAYCFSKRVGMTRARTTTYSVDDAKRAKLWEKKGANGFETPWCTVPQRMLMWRARGWNLRDQFGDVLKGLAIYEEAMDIDTTRGADGSYRPVVPQSLPEPVRDEMKEALARGQAELERQQRGGAAPAKADVSESPGSTRDDAPSAPATAQQQKPEEKNAEEKPTEAMTCKKACDLLEMAQSVAEIAKVMNAWGDNTDSTPHERKTVLDHKDMAMKRLAPSKKK